MIYQMIVNAVLQGIAYEVLSSAPGGNFLAFASKCRNKCAGSCPICPGFTVYENFTCVYFQELTGVVKEPNAYSYLLFANEDNAQCAAQPLTVEEGRKIIESAIERTTDKIASTAAAIPTVEALTSPSKTSVTTTTTSVTSTTAGLFTTTVLSENIRNFTECISGWRFCSATQHYYCTVVDKKLSFDDARRDCEKLGGQLTSIHSFEEVDWIRGLLGQPIEHWIGLQDIVPNKNSLSPEQIMKEQKKKENWEWIDGSLMDFDNWRTGEPNGCCNTHEFMAAIAAYKRDMTMSWDDAPTYYESNFVCKREPKMVLQSVTNATLQGTIYGVIPSAGADILAAASNCRDSCSAVDPICPGYNVFPNLTCVYFESIDGMIEDINCNSYISIPEQGLELRSEQPLTVEEARELIGLLEDDDDDEEMEEQFTDSPPSVLTTMDQQSCNQNLFTAKVECGKGWMYCCATQRFYCKGPTKKRFDEANKKCTSFGGTLTSVHSSDEVDCIRGLLGTVVVHWIGLHDVVANKSQKTLSAIKEELKNRNNWAWVDGSPMDFLNWRSSDGQPDACCDNNKYMAALAAANGLKAMTWSDYGVNYKKLYVCKRA